MRLGIRFNVLCGYITMRLWGHFQKQRKQLQKKKHSKSWHSRQYNLSNRNLSKEKPKKKAGIYQQLVEPLTSAVTSFMWLPWKSISHPWYRLIKVQRKLIACAKYQVNWMNGVKSGGEGSN